MPDAAPTITAKIDGDSFRLDLGRVSALDAEVYRQATGEMLDARLLTLLLTASELATEHGDESDEKWPLADRGLIKWLAMRQYVAADGKRPFADAPYALTLATVTLLPPITPEADPAPDGAGLVGAPAKGATP